MSNSGEGSHYQTLINKAMDYVVAFKKREDTNLSEFEKEYLHKKGRNNIWG